MTRKWQVIAVYAPATKLVEKNLYFRKTTEEVIPPGAGLEWKFTVDASSGVTAAEAIDAVRRSGYFCGAFVNQFGFTAEEKADEGAVRRRAR